MRGQGRLRVGDRVVIEGSAGMVYVVEAIYAATATHHRRAFIRPEGRTAEDGGGVTYRADVLRRLPPMA